MHRCDARTAFLSAVTALVAAFGLCGCGSDAPPCRRAVRGDDDDARCRCARRRRRCRRPRRSPTCCPGSSDPAVPGADKVGLVELATADDAAALDKFGKALADNGALPLTFEAVDLKWSETEAGNVVATVNVTTANKPPGKFSFPMEFTPVRDGWQLTRKTANLLLEFGDGATATSPPP